MRFKNVILGWVFSEEENVKIPYIRRAIYFVVPVVIVMAAYIFTAILNQSENKDGQFTLAPPSFVQIAQAAPVEVSAFPADEAGIAAYFQAPAAINLNDIRPIFRTIEVETAEYMIGSIAVPNYSSESEDVHVYAHVDGWVMAYYLATDPAAKIFDWSVYDGATIVTKFDTVLNLAASALAITLPTTTYYDFRYPNATNLVLVAEGIIQTASVTTTDSFEVNLPATFTYYERSWAFSCFEPSSGNARYRLNTAEIFANSQCKAVDWTNNHGIFTALQLPANTTHTIEVESVWTDKVFGGLALVYQVP